MEKTIPKTLILIFLSLTFLFASPALQKEIEILYKKIPYASKMETKQILHDLENFYINSVVEHDTKATIKALKGIVKCQRLLGLNSKTYEKELASLTGDATPFSPLSSVGTTPPSQITKRAPLKRNITSLSTKDRTIVIKFNQPITPKDILSFDLKSQNGYKEIFDIKANLNFLPPKLKIDTIQKIKIAQNRQNKVRIVLENQSKIYARAFVRGGNLFIKVNNLPTKKKSSSSAFTPVVKYPKKESFPKVKTKKFTPPPSTTLQPVYANTKTIVIDAGHGGKDSGAVGYKRYKEKKAVLKIAKMLKKALKKQGYHVYLTRDDDTFIKLSKRTHFANQKKADLFISIHANAAPKSQKLSLKGIETFFLSPAKTAKAKRIAAKENASAMKLDRISKDTLLNFLNRNKIIQSNKLAIDIQSGILTSVRKKYDKIVDGGVREAPFWVLVGAQMPAVLIEVGYITNPLEGSRLFNPFYQKAIVEGIKDGINNYFAKNP